VGHLLAIGIPDLFFASLLGLALIFLIHVFVGGGLVVLIWLGASVGCYFTGFFQVSMAGPFYCPSDRHVYLDLSFFKELAGRFGAPGEFARAYVIAHEYGHHIQNLMGTMDQHMSQSSGAKSDSVRIELQADCYAGVWAYRANNQFNILQTGDVAQGLRAASAVGDDTLEKQQQGTVVPDSFTHGTSEQRQRWFERGLANGDMNNCDTFSATL
jgi:predicted metalloprotease